MGSPSSIPWPEKSLQVGVGSMQPSEYNGKCPGEVGGHSCPLRLSSITFPAVKSHYLRREKENLSFKKGIYFHYSQMFYP